jgi:hypothetical protein
MPAVALASRGVGCMRSMISVMFRIALSCLLGASMIMRLRPVLRALTRLIMIMLARDRCRFGV